MKRWRTFLLAAALAVLLMLPRMAVAAPAEQLGGPGHESAIIAWLAAVEADVGALDAAFTAYLLGRESWLRWDDPRVRLAVAEQLTALSAAAPAGDMQGLVYSHVAPAREALEALSAALLAARADAVRAALDRLRALGLIRVAAAVPAAAAPEALRQAFALGWRPEHGVDADTFLRAYWAATLERLGLTAPATPDWRQLQASAEQAVIALGAQNVTQSGVLAAAQEMPTVGLLPPAAERDLRRDRYERDLQALSCRDPLRRARDYARLLANQAASAGGGGDVLPQLRALGRAWQAEYSRLAAWDPPAEFTALHRELLAGWSLLSQAATVVEAVEEGSGRGGTTGGQASGSQVSGAGLFGESLEVAVLQRAGYYGLARSLVRAARERLEALEGLLPPCPQPAGASNPSR